MEATAHSRGELLSHFIGIKEKDVLRYCILHLIYYILCAHSTP